ncbi:MAG: hypothetical protein ABEJ31_01175 [Haloarculaceae archaeon]
MSPEIYAETDQYTVTWDEQADAVVIRWHTVPAGEEFRAGMEAVLSCVRERGADTELADGPAVDALPSADKRWMLVD